MFKNLLILTATLFCLSCSSDDVASKESDFLELALRLDTLKQELAQTACVAASDWSFVAYGAKACGGPQGFIAYPINALATTFLTRLQAYTVFENELNLKWGVTSDCSVNLPPDSVQCIDGVPVLIY
jgi:hypothetical protein